MLVRSLAHHLFQFIIQISRISPLSYVCSVYENISEEGHSFWRSISSTYHYFSFIKYSPFFFATIT